MSVGVVPVFGLELGGGSDALRPEVRDLGVGESIVGEELLQSSVYHGRKESNYARTTELISARLEPKWT